MKLNTIHKNFQQDLGIISKSTRPPDLLLIMSIYTNEQSRPSKNITPYTDATTDSYSILDKILELIKQSNEDNRNQYEISIRHKIDSWRHEQYI